MAAEVVDVAAAAPAAVRRPVVPQVVAEAAQPRPVRRRILMRLRRKRQVVAPTSPSLEPIE